MIRIAAGAAIWLGVLALLTSSLAFSSGQPGGSVANRLYRHVAEGPTRIEIRFPAWAHSPTGTRLVIRDGASFLTIGEVVESRRGGDAVVAVAEVAPERGDAIGPRSGATLVNAPGTAAWITRTLLPDDTLARIRDEIDVLRVTHWEEIVRTFRPFVQEAAAEAADLLARDLREAMLLHRAEFRAILERYRIETLEQEFLPVFRERVWPRIESRFRPEIEEIARELWDRLPLWSLGWSFVYGKLPRTPADALEQRFNRFVKEEAIPLLESRKDGLAALAEDVAREIVDDPEVKDAVQRALDRVGRDPELQALLRRMFEEIVTRNEDLAALLEKRWNDARVQVALRSFSTRLQPGIDRILNMVLLNEAGDGISPHLARVLRTEILAKDRIWILVDPVPEEGRPPGPAPTVLTGRIDSDG